MPLDLALGSLLAVAAAAFGVVGFFAGLKDNAHATQWFLAALILGVLCGAVLLDELRLAAGDPARRLDAWLGSLLFLLAFAAGVVGFIVGLANRSHASTWLVSGLVLALLSLAATIDELRRGRMAAGADAYAGLGVAFGVLGLALGIVGFILGLASKSHADIWLWAAVVSSVVALGWVFEAEHRAVLGVAPQAGGTQPLAGPGLASTG
ncbi:MAG TPA: hypothetical protein VFD32_24000 [Dehalococcoidia bacterium]|nr:hypothetical protein [Dehalococcoidia bacterium]